MLTPLRIVALLALLLSLTACRKPLPPERLDYAGYWTADNMVLLITPGGQVEFKHLVNDISTHIGGPLKQFQGNDIEVGFGPLVSTLKVQVPPHQQADGQWSMTVDGVKLIRQLPKPQAQQATTPLIQPAHSGLTLTAKLGRGAPGPLPKGPAEGAVFGIPQQQGNLTQCQ